MIYLNELYFEGWGYFLTNETDKFKALNKLMEILSKENLDFIFENAELRKEDKNID